MEMAAKAFRIHKYADFIEKSDDYSGEKTYDTKTRIATFYGRRKYEYELKENEDVNLLLKRGFLEGEEREVYDPW